MYTFSKLLNFYMMWCMICLRCDLSIYNCSRRVGWLTHLGGVNSPGRHLGASYIMRSNPVCHVGFCLRGKPDITQALWASRGVVLVDLCFKGMILPIYKLHYVQINHSNLKTKIDYTLHSHYSHTASVIGKFNYRWTLPCIMLCCPILGSKLVDIPHLYKGSDS